MIGTLPSCQSSSKNVIVFDQAMERRVTSSSHRSIVRSYGCYATGFVTKVFITAIAVVEIWT
jgi:hypothetical protein